MHTFVSTGANHDLWEQLQDFVQQIQSDIQLFWTPSHLDFSICETPIEEWRCMWNAIVDHNAGLINHQRPLALRSLLQLDGDYYNSKRAELEAMRAFLLQAAEFRLQASKQARPTQRTSSYS